MRLITLNVALAPGSAPETVVVNADQISSAVRRETYTSLAMVNGWVFCVQEQPSRILELVEAAEVRPLPDPAQPDLSGLGG